MESSPDQIVLVAKAGAEALVLLVLLAIAVGGIAAGGVMARRGRIEAFGLVGLFGIIGLVAAIAFAYVPTRLTLDRDGVAYSSFVFRDRWPWGAVETLEIGPGPLGVWVSFTDLRPNAPLLPWFGHKVRMLMGDVAFDRRKIDMQVEAWRVLGRR